MKIHAKDFSLRELLSIQEDPNYRMGSTTLGQEEGKSQMYIGKAVPWKGVSFTVGGVKIKDGGEFKTLDALARDCGIVSTKGKAKLGKVLDRMKKLSEASRNLEGLKGVGYAAVNGKDRRLSLHNIAMMRAAGVKVGKPRNIVMPRKPTPIDTFVEAVSPIEVEA